MSTTIITYIFMCMETILNHEKYGAFECFLFLMWIFFFLVLITDCFAFFVIFAIL